MKIGNWKFVAVLPKINRLTRKKDFEAVFKKGETLKNHFLLCKMVKSDLPASRFGFVVSKKISNKAVIRNRVKRRLRKAVEDNIKGLKKSADVIMLALPGIEKKEFLELEQMVAGSLKKLKLLL